MVRILISRGSRAFALATFMVLVSAQAWAAAGDAAAGARLFRSRCMLCHTDRKGAGNRKGPNLFGVVGRRAGSVKTFAYSDAMRNSGIVWTEQKLQEYLTSPRGYIPGVRMTFKGFADPKEREDLIAFLKTLKD